MMRTLILFDPDTVDHELLAVLTRTFMNERIHVRLVEAKNARVADFAGMAFCVTNVDLSSLPHGIYHAYEQMVDRGLRTMNFDDMVKMLAFRLGTIGVAS